MSEIIRQEVKNSHVKNQWADALAWSREAQNELGRNILQERIDHPEKQVREVQFGDTIGAIMKGLTGSIDYNAPLRYYSTKITGPQFKSWNRKSEYKIPESLNPVNREPNQPAIMKVHEANLILPGQYVWVRDGIVYVADNPPTEVASDPVGGPIVRPRNPEVNPETDDEPNETLAVNNEVYGATTFPRNISLFDNISGRSLTSADFQPRSRRFNTLNGIQSIYGGIEELAEILNGTFSFFESQVNFKFLEDEPEDGTYFSFAETEHRDLVVINGPAVEGDPVRTEAVINKEASHIVFDQLLQLYIEANFEDGVTPNGFYTTNEPFRRILGFMGLRMPAFEEWFPRNINEGGELLSDASSMAVSDESAFKEIKRMLSFGGDSTGTFYRSSLMLLEDSLEVQGIGNIEGPGEFDAGSVIADQSLTENEKLRFLKLINADGSTNFDLVGAIQERYKRKSVSIIENMARTLA